jgi:predicted lipoprotein with Yx(FWY)xxD motif
LLPLPEGMLDTLLSDPEGALTMILLYHVVGSKALSTDLSDGQILTTLLEKDIRVTITGDGVFINDAKVITANLEADNGVVHVIDAVITPPADIVTSEHPDFGTILTDKEGNALYFFTRDADGSSACAGACVNNWPVFYEELLFIGDDLDENDFGFITRDDGMDQTTYKGWPLYYFINDTEAGQVNGDNVKWRLVCGQA